MPATRKGDRKSGRAVGTPPGAAGTPRAAIPRSRPGPAPAEAINQHTLDFLLSAGGRAVLEQLAGADLSPAATLATIDALARDGLDRGHAGAALAMARLRKRAADKFPEADRLYFTREALEQATSRDIAARRAERIDRLAPPGPVLDLGCGIGGDALALAQRREVVAYEFDPVNAALARANAAELGLENRLSVRSSDWIDDLRAGTMPSAAAAFGDPGRRDGERRVFRAEGLQPPLSEFARLGTVVPSLVLKVMPGIADNAIPAGAQVEWIGHGGVCKEADLWFGALVDDGAARRAAVHTGGAWHTLAPSGNRPSVGDAGPGDIVYEPHPAVVRCGAVDALCDLTGGWLLDPRIAYVVARDEAGPPPAAAPFGTRFRVLEVMPFSLAAIARSLGRLGVGSSRLELKGRGVPFEPESLRRRLGLPAQGGPATVLLVRRDSGRLAIVAERLPASAAR